jgi:hypothetical protein
MRKPRRAARVYTITEKGNAEYSTLPYHYSQNVPTKEFTFWLRFHFAHLHFFTF